MIRTSLAQFVLTRPNISKHIVTARHSLGPLWLPPFITPNPSHLPPLGVQQRPITPLHTPGFTSCCHCRRRSSFWGILFPSVVCRIPTPSIMLTTCTACSGWSRQAGCWSFLKACLSPLKRFFFFLSVISGNIIVIIILHHIPVII